MARPRRDGAPGAPPNKTRLTSLGVGRLVPRKGAYLVWDTLQRGLAVQVQPSGRAAYKVIYSRHGRPRWYSVGPVDGIGLAEARKMAASVMADVARGLGPQATKAAQRTSGTFQDLAERYREYAQGRNKSWAQADALVRRHLL